MLWTIAVILLILWALGLTTAYTASGLIHILLVLAIVVVPAGRTCRVGKMPRHAAVIVQRSRGMPMHRRRRHHGRSIVEAGCRAEAER